MVGIKIRKRYGDRKLDIIGSIGDLPALISAQQLADLLGVCVRTLDNWVRDELMPEPMRIGGEGRPTLRWRKDDIKRWLQKKGRKK